MYIIHLIKTLVAVCATTWLVATKMKGGDHVSKNFQQRAIFSTLPYIALGGLDETGCITLESCNTCNVKRKHAKYICGISSALQMKSS